MGNGPEFFQTIMGRKFYEADVPRALRALERIADALERFAEVAEHIAAEEYPVEVEEEESIEPKCGEQVCCDDPDCASKDGFGCTEGECCDEPECPARKAREAFRP